MTRADDVFAADAEVGRDLSRVNWSETPLGEPAGWPVSLRTAVSILLSSRFPMWLAWGPDLTFFCNAAYRTDTLGRKYPWALGRPASEVWAEIWDDIGPRIDTVLTTGNATWDEALLLFLERSGYPEETYHTFSYSPLRDDAGIVVGMLCVVSEDTDRVIGERRMATLRDLGSDSNVVRSEQEALAFACRQLDHNPHDMPFMLTYLFLDDGQAQLAGTTGIPTGHPVGPTTLSADGSGPWPVADLARGRSVLMPLGFAGLPSGGWSEPPTQALVVPLPQQGGSPYGFMVAGLNRYRPLDDAYRGFVDLVAGHLAAGIASARSYRVQQRRAEDLAELDRAKTTFFSNISHEFRTPLTLMLGPVEDLRDRLADADPAASGELDMVHRNGLRLGKLVNSLLDFSRIEAGRMRATYEPVDLSAVTAELASVFRSAVDKAGLTFEVDCPPLPEPVYVDRGMWEKVILNLLSNALKFTFDGSIAISTRVEAGRAVVTVADTGIGVPVTEIPRLFERFHRIENARTRSNEGSGIGLALVKELVDLHGGTITAASEQGVGTRFTIRLPFGAAHVPAEALSSTPSRPVTSSAADPFVQEALRWLPGGGDAAPVDVQDVVTVDRGDLGPSMPATVLVADDNADMREYLTRLLAGAGYEVQGVVDGVEALSRVRRVPPDLVVSDVMMPRMDGLSLVAALRADPRTAAVPVLLLSARAGQEASIEGLHAGADDYLVKPFAAAELLARVRANVELSRLRTHHARWRTALIDSLQEAFFICDDHGAVVEINAAFTDILGYEPDGLPYPPRYPWWPDETRDPEAHRLAAEAFSGLLGGESHGSRSIPVVHRDGHRLWISAMFNQAQDPDTGRAVTVGTFRDVTAEHYAIQRETALAAVNVRLTDAGSLPEALAGVLAEFATLWRTTRVHAVIFTDDEPTVFGPTADWRDLPEGRRSTLRARRTLPTLVPDVRGPDVTITVEHPHGPMVVWLDLSEHRPFTDEDELLLSLLAARLAQGLTRVHQIDQQRETALALQRAILGPSTLPTGFTVRYEPAARPLEVGGDWYDTVPLPDGRIGIVVGDCVGRGLAAAAVMGQLRSACRALLLQDSDPARTLTALDNFAAGIPGATCTTVFCAVLDVRTGSLTYSRAGHPPAILALPNGTTQLLDAAGTIPLAVLPGTHRPLAECTLPAGSTLLMYTDGLVERRHSPLDVGIDLAAEAVHAGHDTPLHTLATHVMARLSPEDGYDDDVAVLLYRHPAPLTLTFPADPAHLSPTRKSLRDWLDRYGLPDSLTQDVLLAVGEAGANAVEHGAGPIHLRAEVTTDDLRVTITDSGTWRTPRPDAASHRGHGIGLMRAVMQEVTITPGATGTTVTLHTRIP
ncbi:SpoIIE family protein phosphatase [Actinokineospora enzanensis]|uniref:SpoIIE family protein phosphatase n=1 Tax=Actinokineospora enzanensis TaxID=155975 RepID=UPI00036356AE|nr:SpoIIE family protein phosphatase [Actinokineospora enzanensis]